jgi:hypothetical protein
VVSVALCRGLGNQLGEEVHGGERAHAAEHAEQG